MHTTHTLIASDIFGRTPALEELATRLPIPTSIVDPYGGQYLSFEHEPDAYQYFTNQVGLARYQEILQASIVGYKVPVQLVGFSVGASACWQLVGQSSLPVKEKIHQAICFYGSQIRHYKSLEPHAETTLIMPAHEQSFDVIALSQELARAPRVTLHPVPHLHGYMNPLSDNYDDASYKQTIPWLGERLLATKTKTQTF